jgi:hypothetical protein
MSGVIFKAKSSSKKIEGTIERACMVVCVRGLRLVKWLNRKERETCRRRYSVGAVVILRSSGALSVSSIKALLRGPATRLVVEVARPSAVRGRLSLRNIAPAGGRGFKDVVLRSVSPAQLHVVARAPRLAICLQLVIVHINVIALQLIDCL